MMDSVNTKIGQVAAREAATIVNDKSFNTANLVGFRTGASEFASGESPNVTDQVRFIDKPIADVASKEPENQDLQVSQEQVDIDNREESVDISDRLDLFNDFFSAKGTELAFTVDNGTSKQVVTVTDRTTGDVIRQIPSEDVLKFAAKMQEFSASQTDGTGILLNGRA